MAEEMSEEERQKEIEYHLAQLDSLGHLSKKALAKLNSQAIEAVPEPPRRGDSFDIGEDPGRSTALTTRSQSTVSRPTVPQKTLGAAIGAGLVGKVMAMDNPDEFIKILSPRTRRFVEAGAVGFGGAGSLATLAYLLSGGNKYWTAAGGGFGAFLAAMDMEQRRKRRGESG